MYNAHLMKQLLTPQQYTERLALLQPGDSVTHGMLFPGVYPSDREAHNSALKGESIQPSGFFYDTVRQLIDKGVSFKWLRVLPRAGQFEYDEADIAAMRTSMRYYADARGEDLRFADFSENALRMHARLGSTALTDRYLAGAFLQNPQASFWHIRRQDNPADAITSTMHYTHGEFDGHLIDSPVPYPTQQYVNFWEDVYANYAEPARTSSDA
jgi:hypothetical protein